jgi:UDP:flavonoid glycosyltransferase YjiC (YdhE family)
MKPFILICTTPIHGHTMPLHAVAKYLVAQGYEVTFLTASHFQKNIEAIGATFVPFQGRADISQDTAWQWAPPPPKAEGLPFMEFILRYFFAEKIEEQYATIQSVLTSVRARDSSRDVIVLTDHMCLGALPCAMNADGVKPTGLIALGVIPMMLSDVDVPPFGLGLIPDGNVGSRQYYKELTTRTYEVDYAESQKEYLKNVKACGANKVSEDMHVVDAQYLLPDRFLQMCVPSVEWPRHNLPQHVRFAGGLPKGAHDPSPVLPEWWSDISINEGKKSLVAVCQGTLLADDVHHLIIPTMMALEHLPNVVVVVALGKKGASLPAGTHVPVNARVGDFIPFDELFPFFDVFVTNGGYGGFQHALRHGLPLVIAGVQTDKPEVAARAEWAGVAVNLRTETPSQAAIRHAVEKVLSETSYRSRAKEIEAEMETYDPLKAVVDTIEELIDAKK